MRACPKRAKNLHRSERDHRPRTSAPLTKYADAGAYIDCCANEIARMVSRVKFVKVYHSGRLLSVSRCCSARFCRSRSPISSCLDRAPCAKHCGYAIAIDPWTGAAHQPTLQRLPSSPKLVLHSRMSTSRVGWAPRAHVGPRCDDRWAEGCPPYDYDLALVLIHVPSNRPTSPISFFRCIGFVGWAPRAHAAPCPRGSRRQRFVGRGLPTLRYRAANVADGTRPQSMLWHSPHSTENPPAHALSRPLRRGCRWRTAAHAHHRHRARFVARLSIARRPRQR